MNNKEKTSVNNHSGMSLKKIGWFITIIALFISVLLIGSLYLLSNRYRKVREKTNEYIEWKSSALDLQSGSDYLTEQVRTFVVTEDLIHLKNYFIEVESRRREKSLKIIETYLSNTTVFDHLNNAMNESNKLMKDEYYAMRLVLEASNTEITDEFPIVIKETILTDTDKSLDSEAKKRKAIDICFGSNYNNSKTIIKGSVQEATNKLDSMMENNIVESAEDLKSIMIIQQTLILINTIFILFIIVIIHLYLIKPVNGAVNALLNDQELNIGGIKEFNYLAKTYNKVREQNINNKEKLLFEAEHDKLTHLYNRNGYDIIYKKLDLSNLAYLLIDIDKFKDVNDTCGHDKGDEVLSKVGEILTSHFDNENTNVFRIGGDEFAILIEKANESIYNEILKKFIDINNELNNLKISVSISGGLAIGTNQDTNDSLFKKADIALYWCKSNERGRLALYNERMK